MSGKLLLAAVLAAAVLSGCKSIKVAAPPPERLPCPLSAPALPCDAAPQTWATTQELYKAQLTAQKNAEDCKALADEWKKRWAECQK